LAGNSNLDAELGTAQARVFGYGVQGGYEISGAGTQTHQDSIDWTVNLTGLQGHLILGLLGNQALSTGFSSLQFSVDVDGAQVLDKDFTSLASAESYFSDQALDLGTVSDSAANLTVSVNFDLTSTASQSGFAEDFVIGTTARNGPPGITAPATATVGVGEAGAIGGLSLAETGNTSGETFTVTLSDKHGDLSATGTGVSGSGTTSLTITGSLSEVNADLADVDRQRRHGRIGHDHRQRQRQPRQQGEPEVGRRNG
jgi:hypothetical protein